MVPIANGSQSDLEGSVFLVASAPGSQLPAHGLLVEDGVTVRTLFWWLSKWEHSEVECLAPKNPRPVTALDPQTPALLVCSPTSP